MAYVIEIFEDIIVKTFGRRIYRAKTYNPLIILQSRCDRSNHQPRFRYWTPSMRSVIVHERMRSVLINWRTLNQLTKVFCRKDQTWKFSYHLDSYSTNRKNCSRLINTTDTWVLLVSKHLYSKFKPANDLFWNFSRSKWRRSRYQFSGWNLIHLSSVPHVITNRRHSTGNVLQRW